MIVLIYKLIAYCATPFAWLQLWLRARNDASYKKRKRERFGYVPEHIARGSIWFHAVSAGEAIAAIPLIQHIAADMTETRVLVTCTTPTGSNEIKSRLGDLVDHCYLPYDLPHSVRRFLNATTPLVLFLIETELWPTLIEETKSRSIPVYLINARLSAHSARGYRRLGSLTKRMLSKVDGIACQYQATADRFAALGVADEKLRVIGNIKFDVEIPSSKPATDSTRRKSWCGSRRVWIAASTHSGEENTVLRAHMKLREQCPDLLLILVPRHPYRVDEIVDRFVEYGFSSARFSEPAKHVDVLVVDKMGVLLDLYGWSEIAFIGGSLQGTGGHNPIEAAIHGVPMLMGPSRHNFAEITEQFESAGCLNSITDVDSLVNQASALFRDSQVRAHQSEAAHEVVRLNQGSTNKLLALLEFWVKKPISRTNYRP